MKKICIVVSTPFTVKAFLLKHIKQLEEAYKVTIVMNSDDNLEKEYGINCFSKRINIHRKINFIADIKSIYDLYNFFKKEKFDIVLSVTPKAGLISSISSYLAGTKIRIHFFTGQVWVTKTGFFKVLLKFIDKMIAMLSTNVLIDSHSQRDFLIGENVGSTIKSKVLLSGSISGVDTNKFIFDNNQKIELRKIYGIKDTDIVFMFVGRLNIDKGVLDLSKAFEVLLKKYENIKLFLIGPDEENIEPKIDNILKSKNVIRIDYVSNPEKILNAADILVLPSYREGFGTIVLEAASMGIPCVASDIYGLKDAVIDGKTGLLHIKKDTEDMIQKYEFLINNIDKIKEFGINARERVYKEFKDALLSNELKKYIDDLVK